MQFVAHAVQAFRVPEKHVPTRRQQLSQTIDHLYFQVPLKIDQHISAEDQVKRTTDGTWLVSEIESLKPEDSSKFFPCFDFSFVRTISFEKEPALILDRDP